MMCLCTKIALLLIIFSVCGRAAPVRRRGGLHRSAAADAPSVYYAEEEKGPVTAPPDDVLYSDDDVERAWEKKVPHGLVNGSVAGRRSVPRTKPTKVISADVKFLEGFLVVFVPAAILLAGCVIYWRYGKWVTTRERDIEKNEEGATRPQAPTTTSSDSIKASTAMTFTRTSMTGTTLTITNSFPDMLPGPPSWMAASVMQTAV
ncbi:uncharacterized protein LOC135050528 [Pseudophryne corroboree]|uniref:uncharacterized protein LOC135050528 n=1 Tax=Pseudophryne corroboree TaxID=495146 RepID=UPI00308170EF